jgi:hypothetical protein
MLRTVLVIGSVVAFARAPGLTVLGLWLLVVWMAPRHFLDRRQLSALRASHCAMESQIAEYKMLIWEASEAIDYLQRQLEEAMAARRSSKSRRQPLFRRVGLDPDCPKWVAEAVRREYRKRLHPDGKPPEQKKDAERQFKEAEAAFADIWRKRGF